MKYIRKALAIVLIAMFMLINTTSVQAATKRNITLATIDKNPSLYGWLNNSKIYFTSYGHNVTVHKTFGKSTLLTSLGTSDVVILMTHGFVDSNNGGTLYCLSKLGNESYVSAKDIKNSKYDLSNLKVCLLTACNSGSGSPNLCDALVSKGAKFAMGFTKEVSIKQAIEYNRAFCYYLARGYNVAECALSADVDVDSRYGSAGNTNRRYSKGSEIVHI